MFSMSFVRNETMDVCAHEWAPHREEITFDLVSGSTSHIAFEVISAIGVGSIADCVFPVPLIFPSPVVDQNYLLRLLCAPGLNCSVTYFQILIVLRECREFSEDN